MGSPGVERCRKGVRTRGALAGAGQAVGGEGEDGEGEADGKDGVVVVADTFDAGEDRA